MSAVIYHEYGLQLRVEDDDSLVLNVLCGRVGQFGVEFALDAYERKLYKTEGDVFIRRLGGYVREFPGTYIARGKSC
jgi:hypothetical protein